MKNILITLLIWLFTLPALAENTILIVGDSISAGLGIDPKQGWVALLQTRLTTQKIGFKVVNASISGDTTSNGLARLPNALRQYQPKVTIIELGGNDGLRGLPLMIIKNNLQSMIDLAQAAESQVVLLGIRLPPNYGPQYTDQFHQIFMDLAETNHIPLVPFFLNKIDANPQLMQPDGIHPTTQAQAQLLDNVWPSLMPLLK